MPRIDSLWPLGNSSHVALGAFDDLTSLFVLIVPIVLLRAAATPWSRGVYWSRLQFDPHRPYQPSS
jgi:hypothetical protein